MKRINVTECYLPPIETYKKYLENIWECSWLTNRGNLVKELETKLQDYLNVDSITITTNGTLPLQIAIKALDLKGEIITTPFSYVATTSAIVWEGCKPVFVDIEPKHLTIDSNAIEQAITKETSAILATHVYGNPCDVERIAVVAQKHNLKVIYDAAHCFGVKYKGESLFNFGDVSTCSFHATKIFHTGEGGCWFTKDKDLDKSMFHHHNFGHDGAENFFSVGINAKISELQAAMGLSVFENIEHIIESRKIAVKYYLENINLEVFQPVPIREQTDWNYHYFPVILPSEEKLLRILTYLNSVQIYPRRYFYPSLNKLPYITSKDMPISEDLASRILALPLSSNMSSKVLRYICDHLKEASILS